MKQIIQFMKSAVILGGILLALPMAGLADKPDEGVKGGKPNANSRATTAVCIEADGSAHAYSCKALSNVVIWCGTTYIRYDDIGLDPVTGIEEEIFDDVFGCGDAVGPITYVAIKSGSQKHNKHNPDYTPPADLPPDAPSGSGLFVGDIPMCPLEDQMIPVPGECVIKPTDPSPPTAE